MSAAMKRNPAVITNVVIGRLFLVRCFLPFAVHNPGKGVRLLCRHFVDQIAPRIHRSKSPRRSRSTRHCLRHVSGVDSRYRGRMGMGGTLRTLLHKVDVVAVKQSGECLTHCPLVIIVGVLICLA